MQTSKEIYPIEGDFIETKEGYIFEVKGFEHPEDRVIAYIRYINPSIRKEKLYEISDRFSFLQNHAPHYLYQPPWMDFVIQSVHRENIAKIYLSNENTENIMAEYKKTKKTRSESYKKLLDFIEYLSVGSGVPYKHFGITGSHLLGREHEHSDLDLVIFGRMNSKKVREFIRSCFNSTESEIRAYSYEELKKHYSFRAKGSSITILQFISAEARKLHQGFFKDTEYFIRFFEYETRDEYRTLFSNPNEFKIISLGRVRIKTSIRDDYSWWITPSEILFGNIEKIEILEKTSHFNQILEQYNLDLKEIKGSFTLRGRYTENAKLLETAIVEGKLECVVTPSKSPFLRIYLGTHPEDKLYPV